MTRTVAEPVEDAKATRPPTEGARSPAAPTRRPTGARSPAQAAVARLQASAGNRAVAASFQRTAAGRPGSTPSAAQCLAGAGAGGSAVVAGLPVLQRAGDGESSWVMDQVADVAKGIPGYQLLSQIAGRDLVTGHLVTTNRQDFVEALLTYGPFGPAVGPVMRSMEIVDQIFTIVGSALEQHNLTWSRFSRDLDRVWAQISITDGIDANVALVRRALDGILRDVRTMVTSLVERVLTAVREAVVKVAEPLLMTPQIKPIWDLAKKVMKFDPLRGVAVQAPTIEILGDFLRLIHREDVLAQMTERGTLQQAADWLDTQFATFSGLVGDLIGLFKDAWAAIQPQNLPNLLSTLPGLAQRAFGLVQRVGQFASTVVSKVLELIKTSLLGWLSEHAHQVPGFHLLTVILGRNPFTGDAVERNARNLIRGFITLMPGGEETFAQLEESGVIDQAASRIDGEMERLGISWALITGTFEAIWRSLSFEDLLNPIGAFVRIVNQFRAPLGRLVEFAGTVVQVVIELVLKLMNFPGDILGSILAKVKQAADAIQRDPVGFLKNMLNALKQGFLGFLGNIGSHLLKGLAAWLFRGLKGIGVTIPTDLSFKSILTMVMEVLGVSIEKLWQKLGQHIGAKRVAQIRGAIGKLTGAWEFIKKVEAQGIGAIWEYVQDQLSNLWDTILTMAKDWIMEKVIERVTAKLISMLDPTGVMAVVNSFIAFFNAVQSAIEYLRDILQVIDQYVTTLVEVAAGNIAPAALKLEAALARSVPIAIGFLANQVGLGNVPEKVVEIIKKVRGLVDKGLDWVIKKALSLGRAALDALRGGKKKGEETPPSTGLAAALTDAGTLLDAPGATDDSVKAGLPGLRTQHQLKAADLVVDQKGNAKIHVQREVADTPAHPLGAVAKAQVHVDAKTKVVVMAGTTGKDRVATVTGIQPLSPGSTQMVVVCEFVKAAVTGEAEPSTESRKLIPVDAFVADMEGGFKVVKPYSGGDHKSKYAQIDGQSPTGFSLHVNYRSGWRGKFYPTTYTAAVDQHLLAELDAKSLPADKAKPLLERRWTYNGTVYDNTTSNGKATVDHNPSVVVHWAQFGLDMTHSARRTWYQSGGEPGVLPEIVPQTANSEKGGSANMANWFIGPEFTGPGE